MSLQRPNYRFFDRLVHRIALGGGTGAQVMQDLETRLYGAEIARQQIEAPIFVTALPRAGTTLLLELLARHPDVATHTYRDMPFIMSPMMWRRLSVRFRVDITRRERAHSDGMLIDADSPEAFEEVFWLRHAAAQFGADGIALLDDQNGPLPVLFADFMRRLMASRAQMGQPARRYASKNNANISRLPVLRAACPDAHVLVPVRAPLDHAQSLLRQHVRFQDMHGHSEFAEAYMRDIGHLEFGSLHRPILFDGMAEVTRTYAPDCLDYWLGYWCCAYRHLLTQDGITFVDMARFTQDAAVPALFDRLGLAGDTVAEQAGRAAIHPMACYDWPEGVSPALLEEATQLHDKICARHPF